MLTKLGWFVVVAFGLLMLQVLAAIGCTPLNSEPPRGQRFTGETVTATATAPGLPDAAAADAQPAAPVTMDLGPEVTKPDALAVPDAAPGVCPMLPARSYDGVPCVLTPPRPDGLDCLAGVTYRDGSGAPPLPCLRIDGANRHIYVRWCEDCYWQAPEVRP